MWKNFADVTRLQASTILYLKNEADISFCCRQKLNQNVH